jgi:hypothetical protein
MFEKDESYESETLVCLVTGAAGFIGSHLTKWLRMFKHHFVIGYDNLSNGTMDNVEYGDANVFYEGDFTDRDSVKDLFDTYPITHVFHLGALPRVQFSVAEPLKSNQANIDGTLNLLLAARDKKVKRFVYSSSSSVYGDQDVVAADRGDEAESALALCPPEAHGRTLRSAVLQDLGAADCQPPLLQRFRAAPATGEFLRGGDSEVYLPALEGAASARSSATESRRATLPTLHGRSSPRTWRRCTRPTRGHSGKRSTSGAATVSRSTTSSVSLQVMTGSNTVGRVPPCGRRVAAYASGHLEGEGHC